MVIGGAEIYRQCLPFAARIHLTLVHARIEEATPSSTAGAARSGARPTASATRRTRDNSFAYSFVTLERTLAARGSESISRSARA